eukprot:2438429-Ditylum_brightwellii.AAC.1
MDNESRIRQLQDAMEHMKVSHETEIAAFRKKQEEYELRMKEHALGREDLVSKHKDTVEQL